MIVVRHGSIVESIGGGGIPGNVDEQLLQTHVLLRGSCVTSLV